MDTAAAEQDGDDIMQACDICGEFILYADVGRHMAAMHERRSDGNTIKIKENRMCKYCGSKFSSMEDTARHIVSMTCRSSEVVKCVLCQSILMNWELMKHCMDEHGEELETKSTDENPILPLIVLNIKEVCESCGLLMGTAKFEHRCSNNAIDRYGCEQCSAVYSNLNLLKLHAFIDHDGLLLNQNQSNSKLAQVSEADNIPSSITCDNKQIVLGSAINQEDKTVTTYQTASTSYLSQQKHRLSTTTNASRSSKSPIVLQIRPIAPTSGSPKNSNSPRIFIKGPSGNQIQIQPHLATNFPSLLARKTVENMSHSTTGGIKESSPSYADSQRCLPQSSLSDQSRLQHSFPTSIGSDGSKLFEPSAKLVCNGLSANEASAAFLVHDYAASAKFSVGADDGNGKINDFNSRKVSAVIRPSEKSLSRQAKRLASLCCKTCQASFCSTTALRIHFEVFHQGTIAVNGDVQKALRSSWANLKCWKTPSLLALKSKIGPTKKVQHQRVQTKFKRILSAPMTNSILNSPSYHQKVTKVRIMNNHVEYAIPSHTNLPQRSTSSNFGLLSTLKPSKTTSPSLSPTIATTISPALVNGKSFSGIKSMSYSPINNSATPPPAIFRKQISTTILSPSPHPQSNSIPVIDIDVGDD